MIWPVSNGESLREYNRCHSPEDGKFCSWKNEGGKSGIPDTFPDGTKHVTRGLTAGSYPSVALATRLVNGTATLDDVLGLINTRDVGASWWDHTDTSEAFDSRDYAEVDSDLVMKRALQEYRDRGESSDEVIGSIGIVLHGRVPRGVQSSSWDASIARSKPRTIPLIMVEYNAGNGWVQLNAHGRTVRVGARR